MTDHDTTHRLAAEVIAERLRQQTQEGWTSEHDDAHVDGELCAAAISYLDPWTKGTQGDGRTPMTWPWEPEAYKPQGRHRALVKAAALILAELERVDRLTASIDATFAAVTALHRPPTPQLTHASDCALHNGPAYPAGPCDCGAEAPPTDPGPPPAAEHLAEAEAHNAAIQHARLTAATPEPTSPPPSVDALRRAAHALSENIAEFTMITDSEFLLGLEVALDAVYVDALMVLPPSVAHLRDTARALAAHITAHYAVTDPTLLTALDHALTRHHAAHSGQPGTPRPQAADTAADAALLGADGEQTASLLSEIYQRATRHQRATDERPYLLDDLQVIADLAVRLRATLHAAAEAQREKPQKAQEGQ